MSPAGTDGIRITAGGEPDTATREAIAQAVRRALAARAPTLSRRPGWTVAARLEAVRPVRITGRWTLGRGGR